MPPKTRKNTKCPVEKQERKKWDGTTKDLQLVPHGSAGMVFALDVEQVVKVYVGENGQKLEDIETERQAYRNLEKGGVSMAHILKCYELENSAGLVFERCVKTVRRRMRSPLYIPQKEALRLATEATKGLVSIHKCGIIQGDVGCHNMLLDSHGTVKIADFAGSSVKDCQTASVDCEVDSKLPNDLQPTIRSDIFALGSAIYEMMTRKVPYLGRPHTEVQSLFKEGQFPDDFPTDFGAAGPKFKSIVEKCWGKGGVPYANAEEVLSALDALKPPRRPSSTTSRKSSSLKVVHSIKSNNAKKETNAGSSISGAKERRASDVGVHKDQKELRKEQGQHKNPDGIVKRKNARSNPLVTTPLTHFAISLQILFAGRPRYLEH